MINHNTIFEELDEKKQLYTWKFTVHKEYNYEEYVTDILTKKTNDLIKQVDKFVPNHYKAYPEMDSKLQPKIESTFENNYLVVTYKILLIKIDISYNIKKNESDDDIDLKIDYSPE